MGNSDSTLDPSAAAGLTEEQLATSETLGYRVLGVQPNSPASSAGLVSFLDFLIGCEGDLLLSNDDEVGDIDFVQLLKNSVGKKLELLVYNIKSRRTRLVYMTPESNWGGKGLIGVTIRLDDYATAEEKLIRVLEVEESSPADVAGLHPETDYLLGTATVSFGSPAVLASVLREYENSPLELYVYNTESDMVRVVTLLPTVDWGLDETNVDDPDYYDYPGDRGLLGAEVGMGYLHTFPESCRETDGKSVERKFVKAILPPKQGGAREIADLTANSEDYSVARQDIYGAQEATQNQQQTVESPSNRTAEAPRGDGGPPDETKQEHDPANASIDHSSSSTSYPSRPPPAPATGEINAMEYGESHPAHTTTQTQPQHFSPSDSSAVVSPSSTPATQGTSDSPESGREADEKQATVLETSPTPTEIQLQSAKDQNMTSSIQPGGQSSKSLDKVESETPAVDETQSGSAAITADEQQAIVVTSQEAVVPSEAVPATPQPEHDDDGMTTDTDEVDDATAGNASFTTVDSEPLTPVAVAVAAAAASASSTLNPNSTDPDPPPNQDNKIHPGLEYEEDEDYHEDDYDDDEEEYTDDEEYEEEEQASSSFFGLGRFLTFGKSSTKDIPSSPSSNKEATSSGAISGNTTASASDFGLPSPPLSTK